MEPRAMDLCSRLKSVETCVLQDQPSYYLALFMSPRHVVISAKFPQKWIILVYRSNTSCNFDIRTLKTL